MGGASGRREHLDDVRLVEAQRGDVKDLESRLGCYQDLHSCHTFMSYIHVKPEARQPGL